MNKLQTIKIQFEQGAKDHEKLVNKFSTYKSS